MAWTYAAKRDALDERDVIGVACQGRRVALYRLGDDVFATSDVCPHLGASLSQGCIVDGFVECPAHFGLFDIRTGAADGGVTARAVRTFATKVAHGDIYIDLPEETAS